MALPLGWRGAAHAGLHAGPIIFREGYFGQTVHLASRIGECARLGEVLVSQAVVDVRGEQDQIRSVEIGDVELKGVTERVHLTTGSLTPGAGYLSPRRRPSPAAPCSQAPSASVCGRRRRFDPKHGIGGGDP